MRTARVRIRPNVPPRGATSKRRGLRRPATRGGKNGSFRLAIARISRSRRRAAPVGHGPRPPAVGPMVPFAEGLPLARPRAPTPRNRAAKPPPEQAGGNRGAARTPPLCPPADRECWIRKQSRHRRDQFLRRHVWARPSSVARTFPSAIGPSSCAISAKHLSSHRSSQRF